MIKIQLISAIVSSALLSPALFLSATPATAQVTFGNVGSEPVNSVVGSGSKRRGANQTSATFDNGVQSKINAASAGLTRPPAKVEESCKIDVNSAN